MIAVTTLLAVAGWNRSGAPRLTITLTERELRMPWTTGSAPGDDAGLHLALVFQNRGDPLDARNWLPESRLREIGFTFNVPVGAPQAADAYDNVPPRLAWVAFEYEGTAWRAIERRRTLRASQETAQAPELLSRLVPVDAAADFDVLRVRYPSGHLILRAVVGLTYVAPGRGGPLVHGVLRQVVPNTIAVPARLRSVFDGLPAAPQGTEPAPRYEAEIAIGRLGLPYLRSARRIETK